MPDSKFVWIFAAALGAGLLLAPSVRAQLSVNHREQDAFGSFAVGNGAEALAPHTPPSLKFDFKIDFTPVVAQPELSSDLDLGSALLAGFDQGSVEEAAGVSGAWFQDVPGDSLRIPEPATFGLLGAAALLALMALHRVRQKSAGLAG